LLLHENLKPSTGVHGIAMVAKCVCLERASPSRSTSLGRLGQAHGQVLEVPQGQ
jgi:hypothetical protein